MIRLVLGALLLVFFAAHARGAGPPPADTGPPPRSEGWLREHLWAYSEAVDLGGAEEIRALFQESREVTAQVEAFERKDRNDKRPKPVGGTAPPFDRALRELVARRPDLRGLPFGPPSAARLSPQEKAALLTISGMHRATMSVRGRGSAYDPGEAPRWAVLDLHRWLRDLTYEPREPLRLNDRLFPFDRELLPISPARLEQIFQVAPKDERWVLAAVLWRIKGRAAELALARRAVFDFSPEVRELAADMLLESKREVVRPVFLAALRHPWPPAADHAARALVYLKDRAAVPELRKLADLPPPAEPYRDDAGTWRKRAIARIDHLRNCLLCHPAANHVDLGRDVTGPVQVPGTPVVPEDDCKHGQVYGHVVFLRPDVSAMHERAAIRWPARRRFDYVVRVRPLTDEERKEHLVRRAHPPATYPQREAVLWAIRQLGEKEGR